jgi:hypothetical protein
VPLAGSGTCTEKDMRTRAPRARQSSQSWRALTRDGGGGVSTELAAATAVEAAVTFIESVHRRRR